MAFWINFSAFQKISFVFAIIATFLVIIDLAVLVFKKQETIISKKRFILRSAVSFIAIWFWLALALSYPISVSLAILIGFVCAGILFVIIFALLKNKIYKEYKSLEKVKPEQTQLIEISGNTFGTDFKEKEKSHIEFSTENLQDEEIVETKNLNETLEKDKSKEIETSSTKETTEEDNDIEKIDFEDFNN